MFRFPGERLGACRCQLACAFNSTSVDTVNGPDSIETAKQFMAFVGPDAAQYLAFTGGGDMAHMVFVFVDS